MFAIERIRIIKNHLIKDRHVSVAKLSSLLGVTEVTIRRDLEKLENEGFLKRAHGGAIINDFQDEAVAEEPADNQDIERQEIADTVMHLVSDGEFVMLTDGPTNRHIARMLTHKNNLTVLTNDLNIALEFSGSSTNKLILLGGDLDGHAVYGQLSTNNMRDFSINHLIVEADGICENTGVTVSSISKASLIQQACTTADNIMLICLAEHFGEKSFYRVGNIDMASKIVTNSTLGDTYKNHLFDLNIPLYTSLNIYEE